MGDGGKEWERVEETLPLSTTVVGERVGESGREWQRVAEDRDRGDSSRGRNKQSDVAPPPKGSREDELRLVKVCL